MKQLAEDEDGLILDSMSGSGTLDTIINDNGTTPANTDLADFRTAISTLEAANAPKPYWAVYHPTSWAKLVADLDDASAFASVGQQIVEGFAPGFPSLNGFVGAPYGVSVFISTKIPATLGAGTIYENFMFSPQAVGYAFLQDLGIDVDDNVTARAMDLMAWYSGDAAVIASDFGVQIHDDIDG